MVLMMTPGECVGCVEMKRGDDYVPNSTCAQARWTDGRLHTQHSCSSSSSGGGDDGCRFGRRVCSNGGPTTPMPRMQSARVRDAWLGAMRPSFLAG